jgi:hypothetical protein
VSLDTHSLLGSSRGRRCYDISFDAVTVIGGVFGLITVAPRLKEFRPHHWFTALAVAASTLVFGVMLIDSFRYADRLLLRVQIIEASQAPLR